MVQKRRSLDTLLQADPPDLPDLTHLLRPNSKRIVGVGSSSVVYRCLHEHAMQVAVKAIIFPSSPSQTEKTESMRKVRREFGIWRRVNHPNIVPLLGTACGTDFGCDYPCIVSLWMENGTLFDHVKQRGNNLSLSDRILLVKGTVAGLEYLHSQCIVHGDLHPANILIDGDYNPCLTDFGLSQALYPLQSKLSYLHTNSNHAGAALWAAPELLYPGLYPKLKPEATLRSDIYSLGSIIFFILSGECPWPDRGAAETKLKEFQNPSRPLWPVNMPDGVWDFIEQCWSSRDPGNRPSTKEVSFFLTDSLEKLLQPDPAADINVVLFGPVGSGKSSIINLLADKQTAQVSPDAEPCTKQPKCHQMFIGKRRFRLWDTMGFSPAPDGDVNPLSPYTLAHTVLRNLPDGVNLIILCAQKDQIASSSPSLVSLYWLINDFFYGGRAPIAFVVTHFDTPDKEWWERNQRDIAGRTRIPIQSILHECVTTVGTNHTQSKQALEVLLQTYATSTPPILLRSDLSSRSTASSDLATHCRLSDSDAAKLVGNFSNPYNVVFFGETGAGRSSVINLIAGEQVAPVNSDAECRTPVPQTSPYEIHVHTKRFLCWETIGLKGVRNGHDLTKQAVENAVQLLYNLSDRGGIDLLVFVKRGGRLTPSERNCYRLFQEQLCNGKVPVALVITHLEGHELERWWETHSDGLKGLREEVIGHACVTSLACHDSQDPELSDQVSKSREALQSMLKRCVSESFQNGKAQDKMTLATKRELTERLVRLYYNGSNG